MKSLIELIQKSKKNIIKENSIKSLIAKKKKLEDKIFQFHLTKFSDEKRLLKNQRNNIIKEFIKMIDSVSRYAVNVSYPQSVYLVKLIESHKNKDWNAIRFAAGVYEAATSDDYTAQNASDAYDKFDDKFVQCVKRYKSLKS